MEICLTDLDRIEIYVISVKAFRERHAHIDALANKMGFKFEYVFEFDADALGPSDLARVDLGLSLASASNVLKHVSVQEKFLASCSDIALVLEDDVLLADNFFDELLKVLTQARLLTPGWLIFLGGADNKQDVRFHRARELSLIPQELTTAEAYLIDRAGSAKRVEWLRGGALITRQADHQLKLIDRELGITQYTVSKPLATQGSITGLFKTSLDSSRSKHGKMYLRLRFEYNRLRRQRIPRLIRWIMECMRG